MVAGGWGALACSPGFDNNVFPTSDEQLLSLPAADFDQELGALAARFRPLVGMPRVFAEHNDLDAEMADVRAALESRGTPPAGRDRLMARYREVRVELREISNRPWNAEWGTNKRPGLRLKRRIPADLPSEFNLYLRGAAQYHRSDLEGARYWWNRLLDLPAEQRKYRTVWAAYMIGRSYVFSAEEGRAGLAIEWMARTRFLARQGFADSRGLAAATYGWQARAHLDLRQYERASELYFAVGDSPSLVVVAHAALAEPTDVLDRLARHELSSKIITALIVARGGPWRGPVGKDVALRWLAALERAQVKDVDGADRVAWAAYQNGDVVTARRWLSRADPRSPMSRWLWSKFLLREGKVDEAAGVLGGLIDSWPMNAEWQPHHEYPFQPAAQLAGDLGVLHLHRGRYVEAMDLMLRRGLFRDAAYVAERVLTIDELKSYVDANWPKPEVAAPAPTLATPAPTNYYELRQWRALMPEQIPLRIRYLLARRLTRLSRPFDALLYYPGEVRPLLEQYLAALNSRNDSSLSRDERGEALWQAAKLLRRHGMELMGTELEPDFSTSGGWYGGWSPSDRLPNRLQYANGLITAPSADEYRRAVSSAPTPDKRFHYRYIAAQHAWDAAQLLPDESDLKAQVLNEAGHWLMAHDAPAAERFYKALVRNCGTTKVGREARRRKWFP
jgi:hypothetical protein